MSTTAKKIVAELKHEVERLRALRVTGAAAESARLELIAGFEKRISAASAL